MASFKTDDDFNIYFEETGSGDAIVFVHEFGGDFRSWYRQVPVLSQTHRCITYSARGFLPSDVPHNRSFYGQKQSTNDVLALVNHLDIDQAHLVGTSMGSFKSLDFALNHPDRVKTLTLVGNSSGPREETEQKSYRENWVGHEIQLRQEDGAEGAVNVLLSDPAYQSFQKNDPDGWKIYANNLRSQSVDGAVHILSTLHWNRRSLFEDQSRLKSFDKPVLLVTGEEDYYLVGETNAFLKALLSNATWHNFEGTGHLVNIERASEFNKLLAGLTVPTDYLHQ